MPVRYHNFWQRVTGVNSSAAKAPYRE